MMTRRDAVVFVCVLVLLGAVVLTLLLGPVARARRKARLIRCRNNLNQLAKGVATYLNEHGDNQWLPMVFLDGKPLEGGTWLVSLYWTGVVPDPGVFICPNSPDTNQEGLLLGTSLATARIGPGAVSYAAPSRDMLLGREGVTVGPQDDYPPNEVMGSDDSEGTPNHPAGNYPVLFFDSHVEVAPRESLIKTPDGYVPPIGKRGTLFEHLRN
jgi:hypothetical protein